jgi:hypothetical protein
MRFVEIQTDGGPVHLNPQNVSWVKPHPDNRSYVKIVDGTDFKSSEPIGDLVRKLDSAFQPVGRKYLTTAG